MNAVSIQRVAYWLAVRQIPFLPGLMKNIMFLLYNSYLPPTAKIGKGSVFAYGAIGVVIHADAVIGEGCVIGQGVTIGASEPYFSQIPNRCPRIGDNVYLSAGAKILGDVLVGNNVVVGAGAVVTRDVPDNAIVVGVPARVIGTVEEGYLAIRA